MNINVIPSPVKRAPLLTLTTDFGIEDTYVGVLKGVILSLCPDARLVDLTHAVPPQDVLGACLALEAAAPYFPPGTIHLAVVDPGVGTGRRALAVRTEGALFVAPDNGLLSFLEPREIREVRAIENPEIGLHPVSRTFHGRDVLAPAAARLASGLPLRDLGPEVAGFLRLWLPTATCTRDGVEGEILAFDRFGNALTSLRGADLPAGGRRVLLSGQWLPLVSTYSDVEIGAPMCLLGSSDRLEVSVRNGSARQSLGLRKGLPLRVPPC